MQTNTMKLIFISEVVAQLLFWNGLMKEVKFLIQTGIYQPKSEILSFCSSQLHALQNIPE